MGEKLASNRLIKLSYEPFIETNHFLTPVLITVTNSRVEAESISYHWK